MDHPVTHGLSTLDGGFRHFLVELPSLLTFAMVRKLAVLLNFPPADIDEVERDPHPSYVFVTSLKQKGIISEEDISYLIDALKKIGLHGVAGDVTKSFKRSITDFNQGSAINIIKEKEEGNVVKVMCSEHEHQLQKYFCTTCDSKICAECAFNSHNDKICDVIKIENLPQEIQARSDQLRAELKIVRELSIRSRNRIIDKKNVSLQNSENIRKEIIEDKKAMIEKIESSALHLLTEVNEKEKADEEQLKSESNRIEQVCDIVESLEKIESSNDNLAELRKIIGSRKTVTDCKIKLEHQQTELKHQFHLLYRKFSNNGTFGVLSRSVLIGGVMINSKQLIHLLDERRWSDNVLLVSFDPEGPCNEYWRHTVNVNDHHSPVVMSCVEQYRHGIAQVLFAVGNTVFNVRPHWKASYFDFVESVSSLVLDSVEEGKWISNIAVYNHTDGSGDAFLITVSDCSLIIEYDITGEVLRKVETHDWASSLTMVAYVNDLFAFNGFGRYDIVLATSDGEVKQSGLIKPPSSSLNMLPVCLLWAGATWLLLWVSDGAKKHWKVLRYRQTGEITKVCAEGTSSSDTDVPVSVTRWKNDGFISFADNKVKRFRLIE